MSAFGEATRQNRYRDLPVLWPCGEDDCEHRRCCGDPENPESPAACPVVSIGDGLAPAGAGATIGGIAELPGLRD